MLPSWSEGDRVIKIVNRNINAHQLTKLIVL